MPITNLSAVEARYRAIVSKSLLLLCEVGRNFNPSDSDTIIEEKTRNAVLRIFPDSGDDTRNEERKMVMEVFGEAILSLDWSHLNECFQRLKRLGDTCEDTQRSVALIADALVFRLFDSGGEQGDLDPFMIAKDDTVGVVKAIINREPNDDDTDVITFVLLELGADEPTKKMHADASKYRDIIFKCLMILNAVSHIATNCKDESNESTEKKIDAAISRILDFYGTDAEKNDVLDAYDGALGRLGIFGSQVDRRLAGFATYNDTDWKKMAEAVADCFRDYFSGRRNRTAVVARAQQDVRAIVNILVQLSDDKQTLNAENVIKRASIVEEPSDRSTDKQSQSVFFKTQSGDRDEHSFFSESICIVC